MTEELSEWLCDSNVALRLRLGMCSTLSELQRLSLIKPVHPARSLDDDDALRHKERALIKPFSPTFTYPIFGEKEKIFGYKGLNIQVSFSSP